MTAADKKQLSILIKTTNNSPFSYFLYLISYIA